MEASWASDVNWGELIIGWMGGIPTGLFVIWLWRRIRLGRTKRSYVNVSWDEGTLTFEGNLRTTAIDTESIADEVTSQLIAGMKDRYFPREEGSDDST